MTTYDITDVHLMVPALTSPEAQALAEAIARLRAKPSDPVQARVTQAALSKLAVALSDAGFPAEPEIAQR